MPTKDELEAELAAAKAELAELKRTDTSELEAELLESKATFFADRGNEEAEARYKTAAQALADARRVLRKDRVGVTIGGDAFKSEG